MKNIRLIGFSILFLMTGAISSAQELVEYKKIDTTKLSLEVHNPPEFDASKKYPAMVFFFGGGWVSGDRSHFLNHAKYFAKRGIVCFLADYRTANKHKTTPFESLKDANSAIRYVRQNASDFSIDPDKIIASGGSAGGHLAAATALTSGYDEVTDVSSISHVPNALVLFNPVIDNGPGGYGFVRVGEAFVNFSPLHNIRKGAPPTAILLGTKDALVPVETAEYYQKVMEKVGSTCELFLHEGQPHGFFNIGNFEYYKKTVLEADGFLQKLGYLKEQPKVAIEK